LRCPNCREKLTKEIEGGQLLLRNRYLLLKSDGSLILICPKCRSEVHPDSEVNERLRKSILLKSSKGVKAGANQ
jgi:uncharacterized protein YbaR (Trm112 family)